MFKFFDKNKFFGFAFLILLITFIFIIFFTKKNKIQEEKTSINGMIMLIEFEKIEGILQWEKELDARNLTALLKVQDNVLEDYPEVFKRLAAKGYEVAGGYDEAPFWGMSYDEQYNHLKKSKDLVEKIFQFRKSK